MRHVWWVGGAAFAVTLTTGLALAAPAALASDASIKAAVRSAAPVIDSGEAAVLDAIGVYHRTGDAYAVQSATSDLDGTFAALRAQIRVQSARTRKVSAAKRMLVKGLGEVIVSYGRLGRAFMEKASDAHAAKAEAARALKSARKANADLATGFRLLTSSR